MSCSPTRYRIFGLSSLPGKDLGYQQFAFSSLQFRLKNSAYVGKKAINTAAEVRLVPAVWPAIVEQAKFHEVQRMLETNAKTRHNGSARMRHTYVLSPGLLFCGLCSGPMEGRSGTGRHEIPYFYYVCRNKACGMRIGADEIEGAVIERLSALAHDGAHLSDLTAETNSRLLRNGPELQKHRQTLERSLNKVKQDADAVLGNWGELEGQAGRSFLTER